MNRIQIASKPKVGIWWIQKGQVFGHLEDPDSLPQEDLICTEKEHINVWKDLNPNLTKDLKYDNLERGRVWLDTTSNKFNITTSTALKSNPTALDKIKEFFNLNGQRISIVRDFQYDHSEIKIPPI